MGKVVSSINELVLPPGDYVMALPGWYPTWIDPYPGDFNQRHIMAAGITTNQVVLYIGKDTSGKIQNIQVQYIQQSERVVEIILLYPEEKPKAWDVLHSNTTFIKLLYQYADIIRQKWGLPAVLHAYIIMRGGLAGWLLKKKWKRPLVLTENWTIYYPEDPGYLPRRNFLFRYLVKKVFKNLDHFLPVSHHLQQQAQRLTSPVPFTVVPNVVDTAMFFTKEKQQTDVFQWVHISTMEYQKNPEGLLQSFAAFIVKNPANQLTMVGPYPAEVKSYAESIGLTHDQVHFTGPVQYAEVAGILQRSNGLLLFSRYENLPCVILEALCCGVPVISTAVGGVAEVINETNGIITPQNEQAFTQAMMTLYQCREKYPASAIAETACNRFSYQAVGKQMHEVYKRLINL